MNNLITLVFFAIVGITFASGRLGSEACKTSLKDIKEHEPEDFVEIVANLIPEIVCTPKKKKNSWFW
jgi:hypothetical protein